MRYQKGHEVHKGGHREGPVLDEEAHRGETHIMDTHPALPPCLAGGAAGVTVSRTVTVAVRNSRHQFLITPPKDRCASSSFYAPLCNPT